MKKSHAKDTPYENGGHVSSEFTITPSTILIEINPTDTIRSIAKMLQRKHLRVRNIQNTISRHGGVPIVKYSGEFVRRRAKRRPIWPRGSGNISTHIFKFSISRPEAAERARWFAEYRKGTLIVALLPAKGGTQFKPPQHTPNQTFWLKDPPPKRQ